MNRNCTAHKNARNIFKNFPRFQNNTILVRYSFGLLDILIPVLCICGRRMYFQPFVSQVHLKFVDAMLTFIKKVSFLNYFCQEGWQVEFVKIIKKNSRTSNFVQTFVYKCSWTSVLSLWSCDLWICSIPCFYQQPSYFIIHNARPSVRDKVDETWFSRLLFKIDN